MNKNRLEAFSDGVIAIIITIMVLELKAPHMSNLNELMELWPIFASYLMSYMMVAIYWVHHHHLFHLIERVSTPVLWANLNFLFWLSLVPWVTHYLGETRGASIAASLYALVTFLCGVSSNILRRFAAPMAPQNEGEKILHAKRNRRSLFALTCYLAGIFTAWFSVPLTLLLVIVPMLVYLFADKIFPEHKNHPA